MKFFGLLSFLLFFTARCVQAAAPTFDQWADDFAAQWARLSPQIATRTQYFSGPDQDAIDRQLGLSGVYGGFFGAKAVREAADLGKRGLEELKQFSPASLTSTQRTSAAIIQWTLEDAVSTAKFAQYPYVFDQFNGLHLSLVEFLTTVHPIRNRRDVENYLVRLGLVGARLDDGIAEARSAAASGIIPPRFILQRVIEQLESFTATPPAENVFVNTLSTRMAALGETISEADRARFLASAEKEVRATVLPAYERVRGLLTEQLPRATDDPGVWRLPRGEAFYQQALESNTTTSMSAEEIHALGLREVARLEAQMEAIFQKLGYKEGSTQERIEKLNASLMPPAPPDPRPILLERVKAVVADAERRSAAAFDVRPKAPVTVKREPAFSEQTAAAHYSDPAPDGSSPGVYWIPLADLSPRVTWLGSTLKSTAYHEAIPGHHFQIAVQQESTDLPRYRKTGLFGSNNAYIEGWALYAERLAAENGWYEGDLAGELGYLHLQLFRARRLVADTGVHAQKWTRQQVIDYGFTPQEAERYIVWPGQACSYMVGQLKIMELREKARAALGDKFSIKQFHNVVLQGGTVPLAVLEQEVDDWISEVGGSSKSGAGL